MRPFLLSVGAVALAISSLMLAYVLLPLWTTLLVAIVVASTAETVARGWARQGLSRGLSIFVTYGLGVSVAVLLALAVVPPLTTELSTLAKDALPLFETFSLEWRQRGGTWALISSALPGSAEMSQMLSLHWQDVFKGLLVFGESTASTLVVLVLAIYWSMHRGSVTAALHGIWPARHRAQIRRVLGQMEVALGLHVVVESVASLITLTVVFVVATAQGLPYPVLLSVVVALLRLVPFLGPPLCLIAGFFAGHGVDTTTAIITPVVVLSVERLSNALANRMLVHRKHNAFLVILLSVATVKLGGWVGLLIAPALASVVEVLATHLRTPAKAEAAAESLAERLATIQMSLASSPAARKRNLVPLVSKLEGLIKSQDGDEAPHA